MKKAFVAAALLAAGSSLPTFAASIDGTYAEVGAGIAGASATDGYRTAYSDENFSHIKLGFGYRQHFSCKSVWFWGADAHYNNYDFNKDGNALDGMVYLGGDIGKNVSLYVKLGAEYFTESFGNNDMHGKAGVGIDYRANTNLTLSLESNSTHLFSISNVDAYLWSASLGVRYHF